MISDFTEKEMSDLLYDKLSEIGDEVSLKTPTTESIFPCRTIQNPLMNINKTNDAIPLRKIFQISIEHWNEMQRECMDMANKSDLKLRELNILRTNTSPIIFDEITKKYKLICTYEVRYNALTNSFEYIR
ncbi:MAG: hypothetical protein Q4D02_01815 [Clostridia bacterium]|nr:hypothetical protein [Clostridia bacterium]